MTPSSPADHDRLMQLLADRTLVGLDAGEQQELESLLSISLPALQDVSRETVRLVARQTFRLNLGIPALPPEFADAFQETPTDANLGGGYIFRPLDGLFPERRAQLQQTLKQGQVSTWIIEGALANAFYFGVLAKQAKPRQELEGVGDLLRVGRCQRALKDTLNRHYFQKYLALGPNHAVMFQRANDSEGEITPPV